MKIENLCINCMREMETPGGTCEFCGFNMDEYKVPRHHMKPFTVLNGRYTTGRSIGEGGFGITYIGMDLNLEVRVAIKEYYPRGVAMRDSSEDASVVWSCTEDTQEFFEEGRRKFIREARAIAKFRNLPEVVGVVDFFMENQTAYIVMEYLDGETLKQRVRSSGEGCIPVKDVLNMMEPLIRTLGKLHKENLIHRDISPDNIMILKDGSIKILDFGGVRDYVAASGRSMSVMVKRGYAPEEQYMSRGNQGPWTDVYSLCATMYYCITGEVPQDSLERLYKDELRPISAFDVKCPKKVEQILLKGMSIHRDERYQSMEELYSALYGKKTIQNKEEKKKEKPKKIREAKSPVKENSKPETKPGTEPKPERAENPKSEKTLNKAMIAAAVGILVMAAVGIKIITTHQKTPVQKEETFAETSAESTDKTEKQTTIYVTGDANIRTESSKDSEALGMVHKGTALESFGLSEDKEWRKIRFKGRSCYINGQYVTEKAPDGQTEGVVLDTSKKLTGTHHVVMRIMNYGDISLELDADTAPITVTNFVKLAQEKFYNGLTFWRIMDGFMMQGGDPDGDGTGGSDEMIKGEFSSNGVENKISHMRGTISMARSSDPDSASSQFFIVQADSTFLDGDYAAFGYVTKGMEIVDKICQGAKPEDDNGTIEFRNQPMIEYIRVLD